MYGSMEELPPNIRISADADSAVRGADKQKLIICVCSQIDREKVRYIVRQK